MALISIFVCFLTMSMLGQISAMKNEAQIKAIKEAINLVKERLKMAGDLAKLSVAHNSLNKKDQDKADHDAKIALSRRYEKRVTKELVLELYQEQLEANRIIQTALKEREIEPGIMPNNAVTISEKLRNIDDRLFKALAQIKRDSQLCIQLVFEEIVARTKELYAKSTGQGFTSLVPMAVLHGEMLALAHVCQNVKVDEKKDTAEKREEAANLEGTSSGHGHGSNSGHSTGHEAAHSSGSGVWETFE